jgi:hypothetical protein
MSTTPYKRGLLTAMALGAIMIGGASTAGADPACTMPNLVGMDLQGAQDAIQSLIHGAVFFSSSTDLTGKVARRSSTATGPCAARRPHQVRRSQLRPASISGLCVAARDARHAPMMAARVGIGKDAVAKIWV